MVFGSANAKREFNGEEVVLSITRCRLSPKRSRLHPAVEVMAFRYLKAMLVAIVGTCVLFDNLRRRSHTRPSNSIAEVIQTLLG